MFTTAEHLFSLLKFITTEVYSAVHLYTTVNKGQLEIAHIRKCFYLYF